MERVFNLKPIIPALPYYDAETVLETLSFERAMKALEAALKAGLDPELDSPRLFSQFPDEGEFLIMPTQGDNLSGVKVLTVSPNNPARNLKKIQGVYVLFDSATAAPLAVIDGVSLTAIRTPAAALLAVKCLALASAPGESPGKTPKILTFGAGIQAVNHIRAAHFLWPEASFKVVGRRPENVSVLQKELAGSGIVVLDCGNAINDSVREADIILCCTSSETALFDGNLPKNTAIIAATGTHGLERREVDLKLVNRSDIAVEARSSAMRENGNLLGAATSQDIAGSNWWNLRDLVLQKIKRSPKKPALYTGVGMSWEDLVMASVVYQEGHLSP